MKQEEGEANNKIEGLPKYASDKMFMYKYRVIFKFVIQYSNILYPLFKFIHNDRARQYCFSTGGVTFPPVNTS